MLDLFSGSGSASRAAAELQGDVGGLPGAGAERARGSSGPRPGLERGELGGTSETAATQLRLLPGAP